MKLAAQGDEPCIKTVVSLHEKFFISAADLDSVSSPGGIRVGGRLGAGKMGVGLKSGRSGKEWDTRKSWAPLKKERQAVADLLSLLYSDSRMVEKNRGIPLSE